MVDWRQSDGPISAGGGGGEPHHLTQRGNNRQTTFLDDHDRRTYGRLLAEHSKRAGI